MTPNPQDSAVALEVERAAFEAWAKPLGDSTWREKNDRMLAWDAWQARASQSDGTSGGWRPIETASRLNGQRVLLLRDGGNGPFHAIGYALDGLPGWCSNECRGIETLEELGYRVTHWMPLPAAPNQGENHVG